MTKDSKAYSYRVIERALSEIDAADHPLNLTELARRLDLSPAHFQRLFSEWVGVSPKKYQEYLTLEHSKHLLAKRHNLLENSLITGLSGTSRLYDLFIRWEAMTPSEFAAAGAALEITYGWAKSPFGDTLVMRTNRGICGLAFAADIGREAAFQDMATRWPMAALRADQTDLSSAIEDLFKPKSSAKLHLIGAPFQVKVWRALLQIPSGHVSTYSDIARAIQAPKAVRAVGTAVGRNPISWLIPCHRALCKTGALGGYHWGLPVKRALLAYEAARQDSADRSERPS